MKKLSNHSFNSIGKVLLENMTSSVNETLATGINQSNCKVFTTADLWNIQRTGKSGLQKRHLF